MKPTLERGRARAKRESPVTRLYSPQGRLIKIAFTCCTSTSDSSPPSSAVDNERCRRQSQRVADEELK
ncbi:hypothetical protein EVAR_25062_1 [Eumeta japonica]|uniref:Uncharacterized protein n=1 Tax=Eumeta variegata TaxID=151549 RepID=A0A4C1V6I7_EUMVA|nr:hypothetical protein EVAR_25062_1 [Eumeta japonica]